MKRFIVGDAQNSPPSFFQVRFTSLISRFNGGQVVNASVDLDCQPNRRYREIDNIVSNRMLTAHRISYLTKLPERLPGRILCRGRSPAQFSRSFRRFTHPLTLNPSPQGARDFVDQSFTP